MPTVTSKQLTELGDDFLSFAQAIGDYRIQNRALLSDEQNLQIKNFHWTLLTYADDFYTTSAKLMINDIQASLATIKDITGQINQTYQQLRNVQKAINIAAAGVTLGAAIFSKNPEAVGNAISELVNAWKAPNEQQPA